MTGLVQADYLVDTNVVSELCRKTPDAGVVAFFSTAPRLLVSTLVFHELRYGVALAAIERKERLESFLSAMLGRFGSRAIPVTLDIADRAGSLRAAERRKGRSLTVSDAIMAATALAHKAALVTRNVRDFETLGLTLVNPFRTN